MEAYGNLPDAYAFALSPSGRRVAFLKHDNATGNDGLVVVELGKGVLGTVATGGNKVRTVRFVGEDDVLLLASATTELRGYIGRFDFSGAFDYSVKTKRVKQIVVTDENFYPAQEGFGRVIGVSGDRRYLYMPAFLVSRSLSGGDATYGYYKVDLATNRASVVEYGGLATKDWYVDKDGQALVEEEYFEKSNHYQVSVRDGGKLTKIYEETNPIRPSSLGMSQDGAALLLTGDAESARRLDLKTGKVERLAVAGDRGVTNILVDDDQRAIGYESGGALPAYVMVDKAVDQAVHEATDALAPAAVRLTSWSDDYKTLLLYASGEGSSGAYYVYHTDSHKLSLIAQERPEIKPENVGGIFQMTYKAQDGMKIPAILTYPPGAAPDAAPMPLVVLPHGGPAGRDQADFDWLAQYFASRGFLVFQPNFRGSIGYGRALYEAGFGEWGRKMLSDIDDGVAALVRTKRADPSRMCVVGASYGGYAALQSAVLHPDTYKCVAAVAPVTDLPSILTERKNTLGRDNWVLTYWSDLMKNEDNDSARSLADISPARRAGEIKAPVLLIHGRDDVVVPIDQSVRMERALRAEKKGVEFMRLSGEDHFLSQSKTRRETLGALGAFVEAHIGSKSKSPAANPAGR